MAPVTPMTLMMLVVVSSRTRVSASTTAITPSREMTARGSPRVSTTNSKRVASAPGPAIRGNAIGKTEMSSR